jgi:hypothetical protein
MKKIFAITLIVALGFALVAHAGLKEFDGLTKLVADVSVNTDRINSFTNIGRSEIDRIETAFGKPLASITRPDADAYYSTTLSDSQWSDLVALFTALKTMVVTSEGVTLPANDR